MRTLRRIAALPTIAALALLVAAVFAAPSVSANDGTAPPGTPTATSFNGVPYVGALFRKTLSQPHGCTASVVDSPGGDIIITAAHCVNGPGVGQTFVPGYHDGKTPYGTWKVTGAWVSWRWIDTRSTYDDFAFLKVADHGSTTLQSVTGAEELGIAPADGARVTDIAYPRGVDDEPVTCTTTISYTQGYPTFDCHGYPGGTSGSPFLEMRNGVPIVVGVIGGLNQGGCYEWNSFSSPFSWRTYATLIHAILPTTAEQVPGGGSDGC